MVTQQKAKGGDWRLLGRIVKLALPYKGIFFAAVSLTIFQSILAATQPWFFQHVIDRYVMTADVHGITQWAFILLCLLIFQAVLGFANSYLTELIGQNVIFEMRTYVYRHLTRLKLIFFDKTPVGTAVTRTISDIETIAELFASGLITIAGDIFQIGIILSLMFWMNWKLALLSLCVLPMLIWAANIFRKAVRDSFQEVRGEVTRLNAFLQEHITGMQVVQIFNREEAEFKKFKTINAKHRDANVKSVFYYAVFFPIVDIIVAITIAIIIWYGSIALNVGTAGVGELTAFIMFINLFFRPVRMIADRFNNIQMGIVAAERIFELIDDQKNLETSGTYMPAQVLGKIGFKGVHFSYITGNPVLRNINFTAAPGNTIAIVGHTGSGKTSLINLISRFYEQEAGDILLDDRNIKDYDLAYLRQHIALVLQDVFLFSGSIEDNIRLKNPAITLENIKEAAEQIGAFEFINKLPGGFAFNVMERGLTLSLGQRQLISFIRALASNPAVIIMDEATSSVDTDTEILIQKAVEALLKGRTSLVIAHRLSTVRNADTILVLDKGEIAESGNHQDLMAHNGIYAELYNNQFDAAGMQ
jgi:ATP-binding cassette subfamily B protein